MIENITFGFDKKLFVLPFDHRSSFSSKLLSFGEELTDTQRQTVTDYKTIIYEAIDKAVEKGVPVESVGILVDEIYGMNILKDAVSRGISTMQTVEKSGQEEFFCEFGENFGEHLLAIKPTFAKILVRYNPEGDIEMNKRQLLKIKEVNDFVHSNNIKLLIEPLIIPTEVQLKSLDEDKKIAQNKFDKERRADLAVIMINEMQEAGIEADVWKIEGFYASSDYEKVVKQARNSELRKNVGVIVLGRGETKENVVKWIEAGKSVEGVIGFAVGRTIFWEPLELYRDQKITRDEAIEMIAKEYYYFYSVFTK